MHLQDDECDNKIKYFTPDDVVVNPDDPLRTGKILQVVYPDSNYTEGIVESPKRTTVLWGSQATDSRTVWTKQNWFLIWQQP